MSEAIARIRMLEERLGILRDQLEDTKARLARAETMIAQVRSAPGGGSGGGAITYWVRSGGFSAASGSWPTLTPTTATLDVYKDVGGTLTLHLASQTVRWFYKDGSSSGKLIAVLPSADGVWDAILDSCTSV